MGNCLKGSSADDISLLRGSESANDTSSDNLGLPPPYRVPLKQMEEHSRSCNHPPFCSPVQVLMGGPRSPPSLPKDLNLAFQPVPRDFPVHPAPTLRGKNETVPVYYPSPNISRPVNQLTEEEQIKIAKRLGLIQHLPTGSYDGCKKNRECVICMVEFLVGDNVRYLPCMHIYHVHCIDDWLMRSFTCPSCMEPVDAALLTSYETS